MELFCRPSCSTTVRLVTVRLWKSLQGVMNFLRPHVREHSWWSHECKLNYSPYFIHQIMQERDDLECYRHTFQSQHLYWGALVNVTYSAHLKQCSNSCSAVNGSKATFLAPLLPMQLSYTLAKFCDYFFHRYNTITLSKSVHIWKINTTVVPLQMSPGQHFQMTHELTRGHKRILNMFCFFDRRFQCDELDLLQSWLAPTLQRIC